MNYLVKSFSCLIPAALCMKSLSYAGINPLLQSRGTKVDLSIHSQRRHLVFIAVIIPLRSIIVLMINIRTIVAWKRNLSEMQWPVYLFVGIPLLWFSAAENLPLFRLILTCVCCFADMELHPSHSGYQNKLLTEPSGFKRYFLRHKDSLWPTRTSPTFPEFFSWLL